VISSPAVSPAARERRKVRAPILSVTALAWIVFLATGAGGHEFMSGGGSTGMRAGSMSGSAMATQMSMAAHPSSPWSFVGMWALMLVAMMTPLLITPLRHLGERSLPRRRLRSTLLFVTVYAGIWIFGGIALLEAANLLDRFGSAPMIALGAAIVWQFSPAKQRCLNRHHARPPLAAFGHPADLDALRFGASFASWCFGSCWGLMLLPLVTPSAQLEVMTAITIWIWAEGFNQPRRPAWRLTLPTTATRIVRAALRPPALRVGLHEGLQT
jgi:predicted metal-binding membrane protein